MQIFITILILLVMLGILISAHEAGHLFMAKRFNVYCAEYSIGFGPKLFSHTRKGGETAFSLRAIPLGGYVSMYGEGVDLEEGIDIPKERSLEGVSWWKRCLIFVAGIVVNIIISFIFCLVYATSFPWVQSYDSSIKTGLVRSDGEEILVCRLYTNGTVSQPFGENEGIYTPGTVYSSDNTKGGFIIDSEATLTTASGTSDQYVVIYYPASERGPNDLFSCFSVYTQGTKITNKNTLALGITYMPDFSNQVNILTGDSLVVHTYAIDTTNPETAFSTKRALSLSGTYTKDATWNSDGLTTFGSDYWAPFGTRMSYGCRLWASFFSMIGAGFQALFSFNLNAIGGIVAVGGQINQLSSYMGVGRTFFFYGGFLSLNLALFNLLPFPGLDGWQLLVTLLEEAVNAFKKAKFKRQQKAVVATAEGSSVAAYEAPATPEAAPQASTPSETPVYQEWKVPSKVKNIISNVGLILLLVLALFITIKDIIVYVVK